MNINLEAERFSWGSFSKYYYFINLLVLLGTSGHAQVSPYSITPDWYFGQGGRLTFPTGSFPNSGSPTAGFKGTNTSTGVENSTSISFSNGNVALYTNTMQAYNNNPTNTTWNDFIRNFTLDGKCAGSSTGGAVAFPDPTSPSNAFYVIIGNDLTGGGCANQGISRYRFTGTGTSVAYNAGPTTIAPTSFAGEALTVGTDTSGGYFVVAHDKSTSNTFRVWRYTALGITGPTDYTVGAAVTDVSGSQSYLKISPCQDKIAYHSGGSIVVHQFNRKTGVVGSELRRILISPADYGVGLEFSPDGGTVYYSGQGNIISYVNIASGATGTVAGSSSWSMQLGPDGKIYASPPGFTIGVISNPNGGTGTYSTISLPGGGNTYRGLINLAWLSPEIPKINNTINACDVNFAHDFKNYFLSNVGVNSGTFTWNFGDSQTSTSLAPTHTYTANGTYNVTLSFKDATCGHNWSATKSVNISCVTPVTWIDFSVKNNHDNALIEWTVIEDNNNENYEVQSSEDGFEFKTIGIINPKSVQNIVQTYSFVDPSSSIGTKYYKIVQNEKNGQKTTSSTKAIISENTNSLAFPNPSNDVFEVQPSGFKNEQLSVYNLLGELVYFKELEQEKLSEKFGENFKKGTYLVKISSETDSRIQKIIKN